MSDDLAPRTAPVSAATPECRALTIDDGSDLGPRASPPLCSRVAYGRTDSTR